MTTRKRLRDQDSSEEEREEELAGGLASPSCKKGCIEYNNGARWDHVAARGNHVTSFRSPAPATVEVPLPKRKRRERISVEEAKMGTTEPVRVYADGVFDIFHSGHARVLMQAKNAFPNTYLIVGVTSDHLTLKNKGTTVMNERERYDALKHCRYVDEVLENAPWVLTPEFLEEHQIDFVAHDDLPYGSDTSLDIYQPIKERGQFVATQRTEGISTSDIIARIVKNYDSYVRRNLERGYSPEDLNIGFVKVQEVRFRGRMQSLRERWERSNGFISGFMGLFGRDGRISEFFHNQKEKLKDALIPMHTSGYHDDGVPSTHTSGYRDDDDPFSAHTSGCHGDGTTSPPESDTEN